MSQISISYSQKSERYRSNSIVSGLNHEVAGFAVKAAKSIAYDARLKGQSSPAFRNDYAGRLEQYVDAGNDEGIFSLGGSSTHATAPGDKLYNEIKLRTNDGTEIQFIDAKCSVTTGNNIVRQNITGRDGTVKELINADDIKITISGNLISDSHNEFPLDMLKQLVSILASEDTVQVESILLNDVYGVTKMVLTKAFYNQNEARYCNALPFSLAFDSDTDYDFEVN